VRKPRDVERGGEAEHDDGEHDEEQEQVERARGDRQQDAVHARHRAVAVQAECEAANFETRRSLYGFKG
jgi:hypothetical protein